MPNSHIAPITAIAVDAGDTLGESPFWDWRCGHLYWVDLRRPGLNRLDPATGTTSRWELPELVGSVVGRQSGGLILGLQSGLFAFDPGTATLQPLLPIEIELEDHRLNDAKCDALGRLWIGSMCDFGRRPTGRLYRVDNALDVLTIRRDVSIPNGIAFSPDGGHVYFTDSKLGRLERAALLAEGVGVWETYAEDQGLRGAPDGSTVDAQGYLWNARYRGGCLVRLSPDGKVDRIIDLPVSQPTSCAFGGPDFDTLFVTTARQGLTPEALEKEPHAGALLALDVGVSGLREPLFTG